MSTLRHEPLVQPKQARPWEALYPPRARGYRETSSGDMLSLFRACVSQHGDRIALIYFDQAMTYAAVDTDSNALACGFAQRGVKAGDRVAVITQNTPGFVVATVAAWKLGAIPVPANPLYKARELARLLGDCEPAVVVCQSGSRDEVGRALRAAGLSSVPVIVDSPDRGLVRPDARVLPVPVDVDSSEALGAVIDCHRGQQPPALAVDPDSLGLILYTSGTTGEPKGAMLLHRSLAFNAEFVRDWCELGDGSRVLAIAPFFHITGFVSHICAAIAAQCDMVLNYRFEPGVVLDMIRAWRPTFTIGAVTAFNALMRVPHIRVEDMSSLSVVFSGGAPIPAALKQDIEEKLGIVIHPCYGMTETAGPAVFAPPGAAMPTYQGTLPVGVPIPFTEVRVTGDDGSTLGPGEVGEICMRGPQLMAGYWRNPDGTAQVLRDGWMYSGDVGLMDDQGWVYLVDRKKDVIIASGFKIWPREVEDVLYMHPAVREAAVIGVPDSYRGETVKAVISLRAGATLEQTEVIAHCSQHLAAYKVPRIVTVLAELPKTITGKIQRHALRE